MPASRAALTARADGALTATTVPKPAAHAFCTISKLARPLTHSPWPARAGAVEQQAADDLVDRVVAADVLADQHRRAGAVEGRGGVDRAGAVEQLLLARTASGTSASTRANGARGGSGCRRSARSSTAVVPHKPHDDVVVVSRGSASAPGRRCRRVTTLNAVSTAEPVAQ